MSKKLLSLLLLTLVAVPASADTPHPIAKLSLASYNQVQMDVAGVGFVQESPELPTWLSSLFRLYAEGSDLQGIDRSRPWGAVIQRGDGLTEDGANCLLFKSGDAEDLARKLIQLLEDSVSSERLGRGARQTIVGSFKIERVTNTLRGIYSAL